MADNYIIVSVKDFFSNFTKEPSGERPECSFDSVPTTGGEKAMYQTLCDVINDSGICPNLRFVQTHKGSDLGVKSEQKIDAGGYRVKHAPEPNGHVSWGHIVVSTELKPEWANSDPFDDNALDPADTSQERARTRGQLLSYTGLAFKHGHRTFHFIILILGDYARLVRVDRAGIVATEKFKYKECKSLAEFLWRVGHASDEECGLDPTAVFLEKNDQDYKDMDEYAQRVLKKGDHARKLFQDSLFGGWLRWRVTVRQEDGEEREFLIAKPHFCAPGLVGRGTRGCVALDKRAMKEERYPFVYVKDAWRIVGKEDGTPLPGHAVEGDTLRSLADHDVQHVPTVVCHGDVAVTRDGEVVKQVTTSHQYWKAGEGQDQGSCPLRIHVHYRLVVNEIGLPLSEFRNGIELVAALSHCILAHQDAYLKAGLLHGDISSGNILLLPVDDETSEVDYVGILNDWELARPVEDSERSVDAERTGTWQFMSVRCSNDPWAAIKVDDELESFFHVLVEHAIRFFWSNCKDVSGFLQEYFDAYDVRLGIRRASIHKSLCVSTASLYLSEKRLGVAESSVSFQYRSQDPESGEQVVYRHPINDIISEILSWLQARYDHVEANSSAPAGPKIPVDPAAEAFKADLLRHAGVIPTAASTRRAGKSDAQIKEATEVAAKLREHQLRKAAKLKEHQHMLTLIYDTVLNRVWPIDDKAPDRKPCGKEGAAQPPRANLQEAAAGARDKMVAKNQTSRSRSQGAASLGSASGVVGGKRDGRHLSDDLVEEVAAAKRRRAD